MGASIAFIEIRDSTAVQDFIVPTGISMFRWRRSKTPRRILDAKIKGIFLLAVREAFYPFLPAREENAECRIVRKRATERFGFAE